MRDEATNRYDEGWHKDVDEALFGHRDKASNLWVDGLLQSLADSRKNERLAVRLGLPLLGIIAAGVILTALHAPPALVSALIRAAAALH
jgi:hypothetical protein